jgi:sialic acid synthase SpsE
MRIIVDLFNQHSGDLKELKRMALQAHLAGADAVKLQLLNSQRIWGDDSRENMELSKDETKDVFDYCRNLDIEILATVFDEEKLEWIDELDVKEYKIASCTSKNDPDLCREIISRKKPTLISTGLHDVDNYPFGFEEHVNYLFCIAEYPTYLHHPKLKKMPPFFWHGGEVESHADSTERELYTGYSDHTIGIGAAIKAYFRGASVLEKHFTLNPNAQNETEKAHLCSFTPETLRQFKNLTRELDIINGK